MMYDVAAAIDKGRRDYQEDAVSIGFLEESGTGFAVLADGMGGHEAGDIASRIVVTKITDELQARLDEGDISNEAIPGILKDAAMTANASIAAFVANNRSNAGMGTTLVVPMLNDDQMYWLSVGDSPLFLFSEGELTQINEDHSLAPQIDLMFRSGLMDEAEAKYHPDRNCLTSVLMGEEIPRIDCGKPPVTLKPGNVVIACSDGLQFLSDEKIAEVLRTHIDASSDEIAQALMKAIADLDDPDQDNVSIAVIKALTAEQPSQLETACDDNAGASSAETEKG